MVQPTLPAGLVLAPATGIISGTPTAGTAAMDYTVIVTFQNNATATNTVNLEVRTPYIVFATADLKRTLKVGQDLGLGLTPLKFGAVDPIAYSIAPPLPDGLLFDTNTGTISGAGTVYSPLATNIVTAKYSSYPDWQASVILSVLEDPIMTSDPTELLLSYVSWGEFSDPADTNGWFANGIAAFYEIVDGAMVVTTTGGDPYFGKNGTLATDFRILEIRAKILSAGAQTGFRTYWSENAPNRGYSEATSFPFSVTADDQYHVYQLDYRKATEGSFNGLRLDTGDGAGMTLYLDYWRFGSFDPSLKIAALANGSLRLSWPKVAAGYVLWSAASLAGGWALDGGVVTTEGNESVVIAQPGANAKFYRLKK